MTNPYKGYILLKTEESDKNNKYHPLRDILTLSGAIPTDNKRIEEDEAAKRLLSFFEEIPLEMESVPVNVGFS